MDYTELKEKWLAEENAILTGWDFSRLDGRREESPLKWDYVKIVRDYLKPDSLLLDMGTGGGELLLTIGHPFGLTRVTEAYPPNAELCLNRLAPLGIGVHQIFEDSDLPFEDEMFDVVINHHESFDMGEVSRIIKPGGYFITQQVGGENDRDLYGALGFENAFPNHTLDNNAAIIEKHGFDVLFRDECFPTVRFFDAGAVVYFAKAIVWEFPGFSVENHFSRLVDIHRRIEAEGFFENMTHRFIIVARKCR